MQLKTYYFVKENFMKKVRFYFLLVFLILGVSLKANAAETTINVEAPKDIKKGDNISISINLKDVKRFYAGSIEFTYDKALIKVNSLKAGDLISDPKVDKLEFGGEVDKEPGRVSYKYTCIGKSDGFSGSGAFALISGEALKDGTLTINKNNLRIQLCERTENNEIKDINYVLNGVGDKEENQNSPVKIDEAIKDIVSNNLVQAKEEDKGMVKAKEEVKENDNQQLNNNETIKNKEEASSDKKEVKAETSSSVEAVKATATDKESAKAIDNKIFIIPIIIITIVAVAGAFLYIRFRKNTK